LDLHHLLPVPELPPEIPLPRDEAPDLGHGFMFGGFRDAALWEGAMSKAPLLVRMEGTDQGAIGGPLMFIGEAHCLEAQIIHGELLILNRITIPLHFSTGVCEERRIFPLDRIRFSP
jgi:hypothetical protein